VKNEQPYETIGDWLKAERTKRGLSLRRLADLANVSHTTIDKIERGGGIRDDTLYMLTGAMSSTPEAAAALTQKAKAVLAGYPPPNPELEETAQKLARLSVDDQRMIQEMIERLLPRPELPD
jgi:transcriptional regulator with XRE-family HTH domain